MDRREAIREVAMLLGGTVVGAELLASCVPGEKAKETVAGKEHIAFLNEVGDTILPPTKTPGAKEADVGTFMLVMVQDCYSPQNKQAFFEGIGKIDEAATKKSGKGFMQLDTDQRTALLIDLDAEQDEYMRNKKREEPTHYFRMMKELTLLGYFTSEVGATQGLRYVAVPGRYDGDVPYKKGDKAWAG